MSNLGLRLTASNASRSCSSVCRLKSRWGARRDLHQRIPLPYDVEGGLGNFLPPAALKAVAVDYQDGLLQRLNDEVRGTPEENESVAQTVLNTAPHPERTLAFNYASLALNNSFFLDQLVRDDQRVTACQLTIFRTQKPPPANAPNHQADISQHMANTLRWQYGSLTQLKSAFSAAVTGMFTSGYVWFVSDKNGNTGIVPTFGPGTLLIRSRTYMAHSKSLLAGAELDPFIETTSIGFNQGWDSPLVDEPAFMPRALKDQDIYGLRTAEDEIESLGRQPPASSPTSKPSPPGVKPSSPASGVSGKGPTSNKALHPRFLHSSSLDTKANNLWAPNQDDRGVPKTKSEMLNIGEVLHPLFCISVHEHAWMAAGYGVWGKEEWLKQFWTVLDWEKVSKAYGEFYKENRY
ncbi:hypothetical protein DXG03_007401 [Asterophora parasitica]|uniref:Manganese/iron superoxide dismutase C-terminal domain-containing protein n=1 Tax=Asterophora parasitica TaxID=117018 RepID=A0A9P7KAT6_9AGAR|nr:hypothetical protein DXG03_007401 [Asterophora parasitica]